MLISCLIVLRSRNVSDRSRSENKKKLHFMFNNFFGRMVLVIRYFGKIW